MTLENVMALISGSARITVIDQLDQIIFQGWCGDFSGEVEEDYTYLNDEVVGIDLGCIDASIEIYIEH